MLKIAHVRKEKRSERIQALTEIFIANDLKRQDKRVDQLRSGKLKFNKKAEKQNNSLELRNNNF
jgi:hypothetical protein